MRHGYPGFRASAIWRTAPNSESSTSDSSNCRVKQLRWQTDNSEAHDRSFCYNGAILQATVVSSHPIPEAQINLWGPRKIAVAGNRGHLWGEQHRIETRTKRNHSQVNSGRLTIGGNFSRSPYVAG